MSCDWPEPGECCLGIPRRIGLVGAAVIRLGLDALIAVELAEEFPRLSKGASTTTLILLWSAVVLLVTDVVFNGVLLGGCFKKDPVLLRLFYHYNFILRGLHILFVIGLVIFDITLWFISRFEWFVFLFAFISIILLCVLSIFLHMWLSEIVMGEVKMLEEAAQVQFTNDADLADQTTVEYDSIQRSSLIENV